jgi:hypothetical protein
MIEAKTFRILISVYSLFRSERLRSDIKLTIHKALIRSVITNDFPAWEFAAVTHLLKLQRLQNKIPRAIDKFTNCTQVCDLHIAFQVPFIYDYITKLCRQQAEIILNHENAIFATSEKVKRNTGNTRGLSLATVKHTTV